MDHSSGVESEFILLSAKPAAGAGQGNSNSVEMITG